MLKSGSIRWVIGQWKQQSAGDPSPFVAQRFDNAVFHVTLQEADCRVLLAAAEGDFETLQALQSAPGPDQYDLIQSLSFLSEKPLYDCPTSISVEPGEIDYLPDPYGAWVRVEYHIRGGADGLVESSLVASSPRAPTGRSATF